MTIDQQLSEQGQTLWQRLLTISRELRFIIGQLSDNDIRALSFSIGELWSRVDAERQVRRGEYQGDSSAPVWAIIEDAGIHLQAHSVAFQEQEITVWTWAIPKANVTQHVRAAAETKHQALHQSLIRLIESLQDLKAEERTALAADLQTFLAWKNLKQRAGTWDLFDPPTHPDEPPEEDDDAVAE